MMFYLTRFGFHARWDASTVFIVHLALCDFIYCVVNLPLYAVQYIGMEWPLGHGACYAFITFRSTVAAADWMSLAMIALARYEE